MPAQVHVLATGYADDRVASTVTLIDDDGHLTVVDPGMVASRGSILDPLAALGIAPESVDDVVFSHHHPDHTLNAALFPNARFHDHWAIYQDDVWDGQPAEGRIISPHVHLIATPGHTHEDISTVVDAVGGLVVFTHAWWSAAGPAEDPLAADPVALTASRRRILDLAPRMIVPGHGAGFEPGAGTPM
jgi:glyoxylase-like metal-dependent hydrolase (beta-lactamase superfamily II)